MTDESTKALAALHGGDTDQPLYWYEQVKRDMGFDPEAQLQLPRECLALDQPWSLEEQYPRTIHGYIDELRAALKMNTAAYQLLNYQVDFVHKFPEGRGRDADEPAQQAAQAEGHAQPEAGGTASEGDAEQHGEVGQGGQDRDDQDGETEPLPS